MAVVPGLEYEVADHQVKYVVIQNKMHYESPGKRLHYTAQRPEESED